jgi:hypothetical protein
MEGTEQEASTPDSPARSAVAPALGRLPKRVQFSSALPGNQAMEASAGAYQRTAAAALQPPHHLQYSAWISIAPGVPYWRRQAAVPRPAQRRGPPDARKRRRPSDDHGEPGALDNLDDGPYLRPRRRGDAAPVRRSNGGAAGATRVMCGATIRPNLLEGLGSSRPPLD